MIMKPYDTELSKKEEVRAMFDNIAPAYDRLNHTLSLSVDRIWRRRVAVRPRRVIDVATGTGDLAVMMARSIPEAHIKGVDLSEGMLDVARRKVAARGLEERVTLEAGDAETAVAAAGSVDVVTVAFGVRNFGDLGRGGRAGGSSFWSFRRPRCQFSDGSTTGIRIGCCPVSGAGCRTTGRLTTTCPVRWTNFRSRRSS